MQVVKFKCDRMHSFKRLLVVILVIIFITLVTYNFLPDDTSGINLAASVDITETNAKLFLIRSHEYCNELWGDAGASGSEGSLPFEGSDYYELIQVHMMARHGDRAPIHQTWLSKGLDISCALPEDEKYWGGLSDFTVKQLTESDTTSHEDNLFPGYHERLCKPGDLTHKGYLQHFLLGKLFAKQYATLVSTYSDNDWSKNVFVHSTNYPRTLGSAAAFLLGFLPNNSSIRKSIPIHHSQGTMLYGAPRGIIMTYRWCPKLREILKFQNAELSAGRMFYSSVMDKVAEIFKKPPAKLPEPTVIVDNFLVRMCHQKKLPCYVKNNCVGMPLAYQLLEYADWTIEHKYTTTNSILMMQPFVYNSVLKKIFEATDKLASGKHNYDKFLLYFAHDATLTPIMTLLGIPPKKWVPYASRLVIELWREKVSLNPADSVGFGPYYIRILFNGQGWTRKLPLPETSFTLVKDLVKFRVFKKFLTTGKFREKDSFDKECGLSQLPSDTPR